MQHVGQQILYQANFPKSQAGKKIDVYYTVYNNDETIHTAKTQSGVLELGDGSYGVMLSFNDEDSYSIFWEIDNSPYVASEEINIFNYRQFDIYIGYGA